MSVVGEERSTGLAGQIEALLEERPWLTRTEISKALKKNVSSVVWKMGEDGRLLREEDLSPLGGAVFALNVPRLAEKNATVLAERRAAKAESFARLAAKRGVSATPPDWRPTESTPEDFYAS